MQGGTATVSFVGSGASVYFVTPANTKGEWKFFLDGNDVGGVDIVRAIPQIGYNEVRGVGVGNKARALTRVSSRSASSVTTGSPLRTTRSRSSRPLRPLPSTRWCTTPAPRARRTRTTRDSTVAFL